ncbi:hypothetical protein [Neisseria elongata]|uniref:hypothetical protein n=1 Tax=Neisseria elongata TaxID=495 RepID=UPI003617D456
MHEWLKRKPLPAAADDAPAARFLYRQHVGDVRLPAVDNAIYLSDKHNRFK